MWTWGLRSWSQQGSKKVTIIKPSRSSKKQARYKPEEFELVLALVARWEPLLSQPPFLGSRLGLQLQLLLLGLASKVIGDKNKKEREKKKKLQPQVFFDCPDSECRRSFLFRPRWFRFVASDFDFETVFSDFFLKKTICCNEWIKVTAASDREREISKEDFRIFIFSFLFV